MLKNSLFLICLFASPLFGQTLEDMMNSSERRQTGIYKLSNQEKVFLQQWIEEHYTKKIEGGGPPQEILHISENLYNGHYIRLSNNSLWEVKPSDIPIAQGWISAVSVTITNNSDYMYPSRITNDQTGSSIAARRVSRLPQIQQQKRSSRY